MNRRGFLASLGAALALPLVARFKPAAAQLLGVDMAGGESVTHVVLSISSASARAASGSFFVEWVSDGLSDSLSSRERGFSETRVESIAEGDVVPLCHIPAGSRIVRIVHKFDNPVSLRDGDTLTPPSYMISLQSATNQRQ